MMFVLAATLGVLVIVGVVGEVTKSGAAMRTALVLSLLACFVGGILTFASDTLNERDTYRAALEERYGVDIDWAPSWDGEVTATKDGIEYTCEISGTRMDARLLCNDPIRDEFDR